MFKTRQSKYTFIAIDLVYLLFLGWHILTRISGKVMPLTTNRGSALVLLVGLILLFIETYIEGTKSLKARMRETSNIIQTIIIVGLSIYTIYLGLVAEVLSSTMSGITIGLQALLFVYLIKELLFDMKGN